MAHTIEDRIMLHFDNFGNNEKSAEIISLHERTGKKRYKFSTTDIQALENEWLYADKRLRRYSKICKHDHRHKRLVDLAEEFHDLTHKICRLAHTW